MRRIEHVPAGGAGTVTMGAIRAGDGLLLEVVVHAALLRVMPWYRGGTGVATVVLPYGGGRLEIERAGLEAPYKLRARMGHPLDKLPPVQLRVPALPDMEVGEQPPEPVAYECCATALTLTLPPWARRQFQMRELHAAGGAP